MAERGYYFGFTKNDYEFLKDAGVSHNLMKQISSNPSRVLEFYQARVDLGKSFACVKPDKYNDIFNFVERMISE